MSPDGREPARDVHGAYLAGDAILPIWLLLAVIAVGVWHAQRPPGTLEPASSSAFLLLVGPYIATAAATAWRVTRPFALGVAVGGAWTFTAIGFPCVPLLLLGVLFDGRDARRTQQALLVLVLLHLALALVSRSLYRRTIRGTDRSTEGAVGLLAGAAAVLAAASQAF